MQKDNPTKYVTEDRSEASYEQLYIALLDYRLERISFLEMLGKWEEILGITSSSCTKGGEEKNGIKLVLQGDV